MSLYNLTKNKQVIGVVCNQWGDSGKGKVIDWLAACWADIVIRGTGGGNAGHTMQNNDLIHIGHLIPCGILNRDVQNFIGNGVVLDPHGICEELDELSQKKIDTKLLKIAYNAKLILPQHLVMDRIKEAAASAGERIGTTGKGIGPAYTDHYARIGLTVNDMLNKDVFARKLKKNLKDKVTLLKQYDRDIVKKVMEHDHLERGIFWDRKEIFDSDEIIERYADYGKRLRPFVADTDSLIRYALAKGSKILLEGAQGHGLSIDYGTMPYVTSSDCSIPGLSKGAGVSERSVDLVIGVVKAPYKTRVGGGPFVTEMGGEKSAEWCTDYKRTKGIEQAEYPNADINSEDEFIQGIAVRKAGGEYGATTGRLRRVGWLDLPWLRYAMQTNGKNIALTKMQIFDSVNKIKICDSYTYTGLDYNLAGKTLSKGDILHTAPTDLDVLQHCNPNYTPLPGWNTRTEDIKDYRKLPRNLKGLVSYIEGNTGANVRILSMGPDRSQTIVR